MVDIEVNGTRLGKMLDDFDNYLRNVRGRSVHTIYSYKKILKHYCQLKIAEGDPWNFTVESVNAYVKERNIGMKEGYVHKYALKEFYMMKGREDLANCMLKVRPKPRQKNFKYLSHEKIRTIINDVKKPIHRAVAIVQYLTGARSGEAWFIKAEDIDFNKDKLLIYIRVCEFAKKSGGKFNSRYLRMNKFSPEERDMVKGKLAVDPEGQLPEGTYEKILKAYVKHEWGFIFLPDRCKNKDHQYLFDSFQHIRKEYNADLSDAGALHGVDGFTSHYLRHAFADRVADASNGNPLVIKNLLGHADISTTMLYVGLNDRQNDEVMKEL